VQRLSILLVLSVAAGCSSAPKRALAGGTAAPKQFLEAQGDAGLQEADVADGLAYVAQAADFCRFFREEGCQEVLDAQDRLRMLRHHSGRAGERLISAYQQNASRKTIRKMEEQRDKIERAYLMAIEFAIEKSSVVLGDSFVVDQQSSVHKF